MNSKTIAAVAAVVVIVIAAAGAYAFLSDNDGEDHGSGIYDVSGREVQVYGPIEKVALAGTECVDAFAAVMGDGWEDYVCMMPADMDGSLPGAQQREPEKAEIIYDMYPELQELPKFPDIYMTLMTGSLSISGLVESGADMVIMPWANLSYFPDSVDTLFQALDDAGIAVVNVDFYNGDYSIGVAESNLAPLGELMDRTDRVNEIIAWYDGCIENVNDVLATIPESERGKTVYYELTTDEGHKYGRVVGMGTNDVTAVGATNVLSGGVDMEWSDDKMLAANPDVIIVATTGYFGSEQYFGYGQHPSQAQIDSLVSTFENRDIWDELTAVQNGAVEFRYGEFRNSVAGIYDLYSTAKLVYPEHFEHFDAYGTVSQFFDEYMSWSFDGVWSYSLAS